MLAFTCKCMSELSNVYIWMIYLATIALHVWVYANVFFWLCGLSFGHSTNSLWFRAVPVYLFVACMHEIMQVLSCTCMQSMICCVKLEGLHADVNVIIN